jgi:hypothetical protein
MISTQRLQSLTWGIEAAIRTLNSEIAMSTHTDRASRRKIAGALEAPDRRLRPISLCVILMVPPEVG